MKKPPPPMDLIKFPTHYLNPLQQTHKTDQGRVQVFLT